jgi:SAM-dependent methyltransferase
VRVPLKRGVVVVARQLPAPLKAVVRWGLGAIDPLVVWWARRRYDYREPIPPMRLRLRVGFSYLGDFINRAPATVEEFEAACQGQGRSLADAESLLDFGCGCGRLLLAMRRSPLLSGCRLAGSDVDAEAIGWLRAACPDLKLAVNSFSPPLPFEDDEFDVITSYSVFTHLDERSQFAWLHELRRVLSPDGIALLTVHGPSNYELYRARRLVANSRACATRVASHGNGALEREGFIFELFDRNLSNEADFSGIDSNYGLTFHGREYIKRSWSPILEVQSVVAPRQRIGSQDIVVATQANGRSG